MSNVEYDPNIVEAIKYEYYHQLGLVRMGASPKLNKAAEQASLLCQEHNIDPAVYVAAQIKYVEPPRGFKHILPSQLYNTHAVHNVNQFKSIVTRGNTWSGTYEIQKDKLAGILSKTHRTVEEVLLDSNYDFDPWFRCLITRNPIPNVIRKYGSDARQQLSNPELLAFLDGLAVVEGVTFDFTRIESK